MKVLTLCVGEKYSKKYNTVKKNIDLTVCTDCPSYWNEFKIIPYTNNPFSFYDKLLVSLKHCIDIKQNLLYVDVDAINAIEYDLFDFKSTWEALTNGTTTGPGKRYNNRGIGYGEGIPLGYYLLKNNIEFDSFNFKSKKSII